MCSGHPHVVTLLDVCIEPRTVAIVTEAVDTGALLRISHLFKTCFWLGPCS